MQYQTMAADDLAHALATDGMAPHEETLLWMAKAAARDGVSPTLLAAMLDQTAPEVTRQRAFGAVMRVMQTRPAGSESLAASSGAVPVGARMSSRPRREAA